MKSWKKLLVFLLALVSVFALVACNKEEPEKTDPTLNPGDADCQHVFTQWETTKENSCTKKGTQERKCEKCGKEEENALLAFGHVYQGGVCVECGKEPKDCQHPECDTVSVKDATCTEDGEVRQVCKLCKAVVERNYVSAFWHPETETVLVREATCTEDGAQQEVCKRCGEVVDEYTLWATGHQETENVVILAATCTENGTYQDVCKLCGQVAYEGTLWAYGHEYEYVESKEPTCTEIGWSSYSKCIVCQYVSRYNERPATGHDYYFGTCENCGGMDAGFVSVTAPAVPSNPLTVTPNAPKNYDVPAANIQTFHGKIEDKNTVNAYTITVTVDGRYLFWVEEVKSGKSIAMYVKNAAGEIVDNDYYVYNGEGRYMDLTAGTYTVEIKYSNSGDLSYDLHVCHAKTVRDISAYDLVSDRMEYMRQMNVYTFTAAVSGTYFFYLNDMTDNTQVAMYIYDHLGERLGHNSYLSNTKGVKVTLEAGKSYTIQVENVNNKITPYTLCIGKQAATVSVGNHNMVNDSMSFAGQVNVYQFVATAPNCRIDGINMASGMQVNIELFNSLNERVKYANYCDDGEGFNYDALEIGKTYTVKVTQSAQTGEYTLRILTPREPVSVGDNMGVNDTIVYNGQANYYQITAQEDGEILVTLRIDSYSDGRYVALYIYDSEGNQIGKDTSIYNGDSIRITDVKAGDVFTICLVYNGKTMEYAISFT